ncbi:MAG: helix-turn-helix transcriptional regulator [Firmicutes bacterium]|jgi:transcriptional regulator with XRE-family HTH domain|nr:helix-turn-helix transcriptional regulator [Bacillota bacterium]
MASEFKFEVGKRIKKCRKNLELTQEAFADKVGMTAHQISRVENGHEEISSRNLAKIAEVFDISGDYLLLGIDNGRISVEEKLKFMKWFREGKLLFGDESEEMK